MKEIRLFQIVALLCIAFTVNAPAQENWFASNIGSNSPEVGDSLSGNPTATLIYVPTSVKFNSIYFDISTADSSTSDYYDLGIGKCANLDCSQPNQTITIICNLGSSGSSGRGVHLTSTGAQSLPCAQAGVYILLGVGTARTALCFGLQGGAPARPFVWVTGNATNGSLTNPHSTVFSTAAAGPKTPANSCMISLH